MAPPPQPKITPHREALLWMLGYLGFRGVFVATHDGSYIDEYLHVFAGQALVDHGVLPSFYVGEVYDRGLMISGLAGSALATLGQAIWAAKLVPLCLGLGSFACVLSLSHALWPQAPGTRRMLALVFLLNPWTLFDHFYLRMYVLYELALVANLWLLHRSLRGYLGAVRPDARQVDGVFARAAPAGAAPWLVGLVLSNGCLWLGTRDAGAGPVMLAAALGVAYLGVAVFGPSPAAAAQSPAKIGVARRAQLVRTLVLLALASLALLWPPVQTALSFWLSGSLRFTSSAEHKYLELFLVTLGPWTLLLALGVLWPWLPARLHRPREAETLHGQRLLSLIGGALFVAHLASSPDLQITRGVLYLMPVYFALGLQGAHGIYTLARQRLPSHLRQAPLTHASRALAALLVLVVLHGYPARFWTRPGLPSEISYIDYARLYAAARAECADARLIDASPSPHIGFFYGVQPDLAIAKPDHSKQDLMLHTVAGRLQTVFGGIPVARKLAFNRRRRHGERHAAEADGRADCLIVRGPSASRLLGRRFRRKLRRHNPVAELQGITLYRFEAGTLRVK